MTVPGKPAGVKIYVDGRLQPTDCAGQEFEARHPHPRSAENLRSVIRAAG